MDENLINIAEKKKEIFNYVFNCDTIDETVKNQIINDFSRVEQAFRELEAIYSDNPDYCIIIKSCREGISNLYNYLSVETIKHIAEEKFNMSIEMVITTKSQEQITLAFRDYLNNFPSEFRVKVMSDLKTLAERINKRFIFDDDALINLIEAANGKNIQTEEIHGRYDGSDRAFLKKTKNGYVFSTSSGYHNFTHNNKPIEDRLEDKDILARNYPNGTEEMQLYSDRDELLRKIISNLLDNLELCYDTYKKYYTDEIKEIEIPNQATLSNNNHFNFVYRYFSENIPHLLGIPSAEHLPQEVRYMLGRRVNGSWVELSEKAGAEKVLKAILEHKKDIISECGLIKENNEYYQMLSWEKIILKTTAFMRGDFFKKCFYVARLADEKSLMNSEDKIGYVSVSATKFNEDITHSQININAIINDLLNTRKQKKDFIFTGFIQGGKTGTQEPIYIPKTLLTGKAENILVGKEQERLMTLERFRHTLDGSEGGIVTSIANEKYTRDFTPAEQVELHQDLKNNLGVSAPLSIEAINFYQQLDSIIESHLNNILNNNSKGRKH